MPTWRGWVVLLVVAFALCWLTMQNAYRFLALNAPLTNGVLVVEGWATDHTMQAVALEFRTGRYDTLYVVGGPIDRGAPLGSHGTFAELGKAVLTSQGLPERKLVAVPAPFVPQDRTYTAFQALRKYFDSKGAIPGSIHLFSEGAHARRSRLMLKLVTENKSKIGVTAVPPESFDPKRWYATSSGFKSVLGETLSYLYARVLFRPN